jgi:hypothetical protein
MEEEQTEKKSKYSHWGGFIAAVASADGGPPIDSNEWQTIEGYLEQFERDETLLDLASTWINWHPRRADRVMSCNYLCSPLVDAIHLLAESYLRLKRPSFRKKDGSVDVDRLTKYIREGGQPIIGGGSATDAVLNVITDVAAADFILERSRFMVKESHPEVVEHAVYQLYLPLVERGRVDMAELVLKHFAVPPKMEILMDIAAANGDVPMVRFLLHHREAPDVYESVCKAIHHPPVIALLVASGIDDPTHWLKRACAGSQLKLATVLLEAMGADAVLDRSDQHSLCERLWEQDVATYLPVLLRHCREFSPLALYYLVRNDQLEAARIVLEYRRPDLLLPPYDQRSLQWFLYEVLHRPRCFLTRGPPNNKLLFVKLLLQHGADPHGESVDALVLAASSADEAVVSFLLEHQRDYYRTHVETTQLALRCSTGPPARVIQDPPGYQATAKRLQEFVDSFM